MDLETLREKIEQGDFEGVKDFIKNHPDSINKKDGLGRTALMFAAGKGKTDILKLLLNNVADVNTRHRKFGCTALHLAVEWNRREAVEELLKKTTIQVNLEDRDGQTPLHWACSKGYKDIVGLFLSHIGIKPNVVDQNRDTPLHWAVRRQNYDVVTLMLSQESVYFEMKNNKNRTPLLEAVSGGHLGIMQKVIARSANVNVVDNEGNNCLHLALQTNAFHSEVEHITILDEYAFKLSLNQKDRTCNTVVASYLFHFGANFYHPNGEDVTPLDLIRDKKLKEKLKTFLPPPCTYCRVRASAELKHCGHTVLCRECYMKIKCKTCPTCQQPIRGLGGFERPIFEEKEVRTVAEPVENTNIEEQGVQSVAEPGGSSNLKEKDLLRVAKRLGSNWWQVAIYLGIETTELKMDDESIDTVKQGYLMLYEWFRRCDPETRTHATLSAALEEAECFTALECLSLDAK